jgi:hypothetical protein
MLKMILLLLKISEAKVILTSAEVSVLDTELWRCCSQDSHTKQDLSLHLATVETEI